ncbi:AAA family ATPase [Pseudanabaena minima]|uniref:AAA family ATPase n=1 Tax=Pseudanabaena minima TaxID=890415 RepID=UPI003DA893BA
MLKHISIKGFKSIKELELDLSPINVLIGANGSGKSNFISFFKLLRWMLQSQGELQFFVGQSGGASSLLFDGVESTTQIETELSFESILGKYDYSFRLAYAASDTFIFAEERFGETAPTLNLIDVNEGNKISSSDYLNTNQLVNSSLNPDHKNLNIKKARFSSHRESKLIDLSISENQLAKNIFSLIQNFVIYQFHNTSHTARFKRKWDINDNQSLKWDAGNLAPFLLKIKENNSLYYQRIVESLRQIVPFFDEFALNPIKDNVLLQWKERGTDLIFSPNQASDGTLRAMSLVTLLLQPPDSLPDVLILDEPELGLHPYAINIIGSLINSVSNRCQVILATQSPLLVDCFEPEDIIVVERNDRESSFKRLVVEELEDWLEEYSLSELWNKNVIGGRPS